MGQDIKGDRKVMKYIRTKDGIYVCPPSYLITKIYETPKGLEPLRYADGTLEQVGDKYVSINDKDYKITDTNIADTIEELCDEGVCNNSLIGFVDIRGFKLYKKYKCYGAIWTYKGLIYVAKMNDKGELELL